jgi:hypothetical protein
LVNRGIPRKNAVILLWAGTLFFTFISLLINYKR